MYLGIFWELIANPLGSAGHTLGTAALCCGTYTDRQCYLYHLSRVR